jgi:hypothetical protein
MSAGKPRIVTFYSSFNAETLYSLHHSLYNQLKRKGWLLVGNPTDEQVRGLNGAGPYQSVDYESATDNIKLEYVRATLEVLISKGVDLTPAERACLRVVGDLVVDDVGCSSGQPMGSYMSFPLLCLINKTIVDLSLASLLERGEVSWKQFQKHRCLINGDDLLYREISNNHDIFTGILFHGKQVGLVTNYDKTVTSYREGEINSTLFRDGRKIKKSNLGALSPGSRVSDILGFALESSRTKRGFIHLVNINRRLLRNQDIKIHSPLPARLVHVLGLWANELAAIPSKKARPPNAFPVVPQPEGFEITRREAVALIREEVERLRDCGHVPEEVKNGVTTVIGYRKSWFNLLREKRPISEKRELRLLVASWEEKVKEKLREAEFTPKELIPPLVGDGPRAHVILDHIKAFKLQREFIGNRESSTCDLQDKILLEDV